MALAFDSTMASNAGVRHTTSPATFSFTNTAGNVIYICAVGSVSSGSITWGACSYGGQALTNITPSSGLNYDSNHGAVVIYRLASGSLPTGSNTVSLAWTNADSIIVGCVTFSGADTTTPDGTPATATGTGTTATVDVTSTTSGNIVIDVVGTGTSISTIGANQTERWILNNSSNTSADNARSSTEASSGGTITMSHTVSSDVWGIVAVEVKAASATPVQIPVSIGSTPQTGRAPTLGFGIDMPNQAMGITGRTPSMDFVMSQASAAVAMAGRALDGLEIRNTGQILISPA